MKGSTVFLVMAILFGLNCFGQAPTNRAASDTPQADPGYTISVESPSEPFRLGSPMTIVIKVTVGDKEIYWRAERSDTSNRAFHFLLTKGDREVQTTLMHRRMRGKLLPDDPPVDFESSGSSSIVQALTPGTSLTFTIDLTKLYEITEPGTYTLDIRRIEEGNKTIVRAKPVTLNIVQ
jgi:hypothetical protein